MTILIIEDEEATARKLKRLLADVDPTATVVGVLGSVVESVEWLQSQPAPDLMLLDIELADGQSFEIFKHVAVSSPVIFTTAYDEYALKAFRVNSIDYLLKPVKEADLRGALAKLRAMKQVLAYRPGSLQASLTNPLQQLNLPSTLTPAGEPSPTQQAERHRFLVKQGHRLFSVSIEEVAYFLAATSCRF